MAGEAQRGHAQHSGQSRFTTPWSPYLTPPDSAHPASTRLHSNTSSMQSRLSRPSHVAPGAVSTRRRRSRRCPFHLRRSHLPATRWRQQWTRRRVLAAVAVAAPRERIAAAMARGHRALAAPEHPRQSRVRARACGDGVGGVAAAHAGPGSGEAAEERSDAPRPQPTRRAGARQPLTAAIMSFCRGNYEGAVASISAIRTAADRCGGSVSQCDLIHLTLLEAALRAQQTGRARTWRTSAPRGNREAVSIGGSRRGRGHSASRGGRRDSCSMEHVGSSHSHCGRVA
jgi:hypothetical protein